LRDLTVPFQLSSKNLRDTEDSCYAASLVRFCESGSGEGSEKEVKVDKKTWVR